MPSEPIEAEFVHPPTLSPEQEEEFRNLDIENLLSQLSRHKGQPHRPVLLPYIPPTHMSSNKSVQKKVIK